MKKLILALFVAGLVLAAGCTDYEPIPTGDQEDKVIVGFSMGTLMEDRWIRDRDIFLAKAKQEGIEVIVNNANRDSNLQYKQVMEMINQGIDVLVIAPNDCYSEVRCVKAAKDRGIPVISYDRLVMNADVDVYISFDHFKVGKLMAQELIKKAPEGGYLLVSGPKSDYNTELIYQGVMSVLESNIESGKISLLGETWVEGWTRETAYQYVSDQLEMYGEDIKGIICGNDSLAWGVIDALSEAQMAEQVVVSGQDADLVACQRIVTGKQTMTTYKPIQELVEKTVKVCVDLVNGKDIMYETTIFDGTYDVPYIYIDVVPVTRENIDETVIKDGFHLYEDVYLNGK